MQFSLSHSSDFWSSTFLIFPRSRCCGSGFTESEHFKSIRIRIQGFDDQKLKKMQLKNFLYIFLIKNCNPVLKRLNLLTFLFFWVIFILLDPDPIRSRIHNTAFKDVVGLLKWNYGFPTIHLGFILLDARRLFVFRFFYMNLYIAYINVFVIFLLFSFIVSTVLPSGVELWWDLLPLVLGKVGFLNDFFS